MTNTDQADALKPCHELKTDPEVFDAMHRDEKNFEIRFNDRNYKVGDRLRLRRTQYSGVQMKQNPTLCPLLYTGEELLRSVAYILAGPAYGLESGWVIMAVQTTRAPEPEGEPVCIHCGEAENAHSAGGMLKCPEYHKGPFWTWRDTVFKAAPTAQPEAEPTTNNSTVCLTSSFSSSPSSSASGLAGISSDHEPTAGSGSGEASRNWSDGGENGDYQNQCVCCSELFFGHKRRVVCRRCFTNSPDVQSVLALEVTAATSTAEQALQRTMADVEHWKKEARILTSQRDRAKGELAAAEQAKAQAEQERDAFKSERVNVLLMIAKDTMLGPYEGRETFYSRVADVVKAYKQAEAERDAVRAEVERLKRQQATSAQEDLATAIEDGNRSRQIIYAMAEELRPEEGEHNIDCARRVAEERDQLTRELAEAREALRAALIPLAVLKMGQQTKPYAEHTATLTAEIASAHDAVYAALTKAQEGKA